MWCPSGLPPFMRLSTYSCHVPGSISRQWSLLKNESILAFVRFTTCTSDPLLYSCPPTKPSLKILSCSVRSFFPCIIQSVLCICSKNGINCRQWPYNKVVVRPAWGINGLHCFCGYSSFNECTKVNSTIARSHDRTYKTFLHIFIHSTYFHIIHTYTFLYAR